MAEEVRGADLTTSHLTSTRRAERKAPVSVNHLQVALERVHDRVLVAHQAEPLLAPMAPTNKNKRNALATSEKAKVHQPQEHNNNNNNNKVHEHDRNEWP